MAKYVGFRQGKVHESHVISEYYCGGCGWPVTDHDSFCPECGGAFRKCDADDESIRRLEEENARLQEILKSLMMGTNAELCAGRDESDCKKCSMYHGEDGCIVVNTMKLLGIDMYGEPLRIEVEK